MLGKILGSIIGAGASVLGAKSNLKSQKDFAKKGIQWKVADSLKAGIHPIYGLGANTMSFTPSNVGGEVSQIASNLGADIDRSRMATADAPARGVLGKLALERAGLENDLLRSQIASTRARLSGPAIGPPPGQALKFPDGSPFATGDSTPAQVMQDNYGDLVEGGYGLWRLDKDVTDNNPNWYLNPTVKKSSPFYYTTRRPPPLKGGYPRFGGR